MQYKDAKPLYTSESSAAGKFFVCVVLSLVLMTLDHRKQVLDPLRDFLSSTAYPLQMITQAPREVSEWLDDALSSRRHILNENARLQDRQLFLDAQIQKLTALEAENRRLRMLLESSANFSERVLIAELVSVDFDPYRHQILLNKGQRHDVHDKQPLINQDGVVGQIVKSNSLTSTAVLITDPNHSLPVQIVRNGLRTLAVGTGNFDELELPHVPNNGDVKVGDMLITSGLGGRFPRGYPVAQVTRVDADPGRPFARIFAKPMAQLDRSREVLVLETVLPAGSIAMPALEAPVAPVAAAAGGQ